MPSSAPSTCSFLEVLRKFLRIWKAATRTSHRLPCPRNVSKCPQRCRHFKPPLKRTELPQSRWHDLRHTCATILLLAGKHPEYVHKPVGHASLCITPDTYSHVIEGMDEAR